MEPRSPSTSLNASGRYAPTDSSMLCATDSSRRAFNSCRPSRVSVIIWYIRRAVASWASNAVTVAWVAALRGAAAVALMASSSRWVDATSRRE